MRDKWPSDLRSQYRRILKRMQEVKMSRSDAEAIFLPEIEKLAKARKRKERKR